MHKNTTVRSLFVIGLVVVSVFAGVTIPGAVAAQDATTNGTTTDNGTSTANGTMMGTVSLTANQTTAGVITNQTVNITIGNAVAGNLTTVRINYTGTNVSTAPALGNVSISIAGQRIPIPANATVGATGFVEAGVPTVLRVSFDLNQSLQPEVRGQLTLVYPVQLPSEPGNYTVDILLNPESDAVSLTTNLTVTANEAAPTTGANGTTMAGTTGATTMGGTTGATTMAGTTGATTMAGTTGATTMAGTTGATTMGGTATNGAGDATTGGGGDGTTTSSGNGPGFSVLVAIVGVLAAALLALRRN